MNNQWTSKTQILKNDINNKIIKNKVTNILKFYR